MARRCRNGLRALLIGTLLVALSGSVAAALSPASLSAAGSNARFEPRDGHVYLGVSTHLITTGLNAWDRAAGITSHPALYGRWTTPDGPFQPILDEVKTRPGITPVIHWNLPMDGRQITNGSRDAYIRVQVAAVRAYAKPVFVRLDWEMNAYWYPHWNLSPVTPAQYIASWRRAVSLFARVPNVAFVWCPNVLDYFNKAGKRFRTSLWYPGDSYVDWVGLDAYPQSTTKGALLNGTDGMNDMAKFAAAHHKPLMLAEWAPNLPHADTTDAVNLIFTWAEKYPHTVKALVYFDFVVGGRDFRLTSHPNGARAFRHRSANRSHYLLNVTAAAIPAPSSRGAAASSLSRDAPMAVGVAF